MWADFPDDWEQLHFSDVLCEQVRREKPISEKQYPLLGVKWYGQGPFHRETRLGASLSAPYLFEVSYGDIIYNKLFAWKGSFGVIVKDYSGYFVSNEFPLFSLDRSRVAPEFFAWALRSPRLAERANVFSTGTTSISRNRLDESDFLSFPLALPSYPEQLAIAEVLQSAEDAIARKRELIGTLGETKKAVMRELLTKGTRRDNAALKPLPERWVLGRIAEGVDQIPQDWKLVRLTSVAKLESGHTPSRTEPHYWEGDIPWISLQDADALTSNTISDTAETIGPEGLKNSSARMLPPGTVVFQRTANVGLSSIMGREMCTSQHFANWVCGPKLVPGYLVQVFRHMQREWLRLMAGSVLPDIYMPTFKRLQILLPPKEEQTKIADTGEAFDRRIDAEKRSLAELQNTRSALAQELLSGRLRLPASMIARFENSPPSGKTPEAVTA